MTKVHKNWPVVEIPADGKSGMNGGAYSHFFVYSNKGNFLIKGYYRECQTYLEKRKQEGLKYFVNKLLICTKPFGASRSIWDFYKKDVSIWEPDRTGRSSFRDKKWTVRYYSGKGDKKEPLHFKRLPKRWISLFENF